MKLLNILFAVLLGILFMITPLAQTTPPQKIVKGRLEITTPFARSHRIAFSPDSKYFAVMGIKDKWTGLADSIHHILVYETNSQKLIQTLNIKPTGVAFGGVAFSSDGKYLAGGTGIITLWDTKTWQPVRDIEGPFARGIYASRGLESLAFSPDSQSIAIQYSDVISPETLTTNFNSLDEVRALAGNKSVSNAGAIMVFDVNTARRKFVLLPDRTETRHVEFVSAVKYSPDGRYLLSSQAGGIFGDKITKDDDPSKRETYLRFRDSQTGKVLKEIDNIHVMDITATAYSPNSKWVATGTSTTDKHVIRHMITNQWFPLNNQDPIRLWDVASGKKIMEFGSLRGAVVSLALTQDNKTLISCQTDVAKKETIWLWDIASGQLIERVETPNTDSEFFSCVISPDGHTIALPALNKVYLIHI